jgi:hypothetical protein
MAEAQKVLAFPFFPRGQSDTRIEVVAGFISPSKENLRE